MNNEPLLEANFEKGCSPKNETEAILTPELTSTEVGRNEVQVLEEAERGETFLRRVWRSIDSTYGPFRLVYPSNFKEGLKMMWHEVWANWRSGVTVSLVNVPLSISLALAASATPDMGVITACWAGLFSALLGGSHYNVVGPTGALSGILSLYAFHYGLDVLPMLSFLAGIIILVIWLLRLDKYFLFIPSAVVEGFTVGVAFIIALNQLNFILGLSSLEHREQFYMNTFESLVHLRETNLWALFFFLVAFLSLLILGRLLPVVPWTILVAVIGVIVGALVDLKVIPLNLRTINQQYPGYLDNFYPFKFPRIRAEFFNVELLIAACYVAFVAILESLISAKIADKMTHTRFSPPREVFSVAVCNLACGIAGGIPATAALARTALNIKSGATSRISGLINAFSTFIISVALIFVFKYLILPVVGAILVVVAVKMIEFKNLSNLFKTDKKMFILFLVTAIICVTTEPTKALIFGAAIGMLMFAGRNNRAYGELITSKEHATIAIWQTLSYDRTQYNMNSPSFLVKPTSDQHFLVAHATEGFPDTAHYSFIGELTFMNSQSHTHRLKNLDLHLKTIILDFKYLFDIDIDGLESLHEVVHYLEKQERLVLLCSVSDEIEGLFKTQSWYHSLGKEGKILCSEEEAASKAPAILLQTESNQNETEEMEEDDSPQRAVSQVELSESSELTSPINEGEIAIVVK